MDIFVANFRLVMFNFSGPQMALLLEIKPRKKKVQNWEFWGTGAALYILSLCVSSDCNIAHGLDHRLSIYVMFLCRGLRSNGCDQKPA